MTINGNAINELIATDEELYQRWLRDPSAEVVHLVDITYLGDDGSGNPTPMQLYVSDRVYPPYRAVLDEPPTMSRQIGTTFTGAAQVSLGEIRLKNSSGLLDSWLWLNWDGQPFVVRHGDPSWPVEQFRDISHGVIESVASASTTEIVIRTRAADYAQNKVIQETLYASGTPAQNRPKPLLYGTCYNVSPVLIDAGTLTYQVHDGAISAVHDVRDGGVTFGSTTDAVVASVDSGTETITTVDNHGALEDDRIVFLTGTPPAPLALDTDYYVLASGLGAKTVKLSLTKGGAAINLTTTTTGATFAVYHWVADVSTGIITLSSSPSGQLTADVTGLGDGALDVITTYVLEADNVGDPMPGCPTDADLPIGVYVTERTNRLDLANQIATGCNLWYGRDRQGMLRFGRVTGGAGYYSYDEIEYTYTFVDSPEYDFVDICDDDMVSGGKLVLESVSMPKIGHKLGVARRWTVQSSGLVAAVTDDMRSFYGAAETECNAWVESEVTDSKKAEAHALATTPETIHSHISLFDPLSPRNPGDAMLPYATGVGAYLALRDAGWGATFSCTVGRVGYGIDIGRSVRVTSARYGLSAGRVMECVGVEDRGGVVKLTFYKQMRTSAPTGGV